MSHAKPIAKYPFQDNRLRIWDRFVGLERPKQSGIFVDEFNKRDRRIPCQRVFSSRYNRREELAPPLLVRSLEFMREIGKPERTFALIPSNAVPCLQSKPKWEIDAQAQVDAFRPQRFDLLGQRLLLCSI